MRRGAEEVAAVYSRLLHLYGSAGTAAQHGMVPQQTIDLLFNTAGSIISQAMLASEAEALIGEAAQADSRSPLSEDDILEESLDDATRSTLPLYTWLLHNLSYPHPSYGVTMELVHEAAEAGWVDADRHKVDDWFRRHRQTCGYTLICKKYCDDDVEKMRVLCNSVLSRAREEYALDTTVDQDAADDIQAMHEDVARACGYEQEEFTSSWFDELNDRVVAIVDGGLPVSDDSDHMDAWSVDDDMDDIATEVDSLCGDDDVTGVDLDERGSSPLRVAGVKRKYDESVVYSALPSALHRTESASSSSSNYSSASFRSFSGSSASSFTSVGSDGETESRPVKRHRSSGGGLINTIAPSRTSSFQLLVFFSQPLQYLSPCHLPPLLRLHKLRI